MKFILEVIHPEVYFCGGDGKNDDYIGEYNEDYLEKLKLLVGKFKEREWPIICVRQAYVDYIVGLFWKSITNINLHSIGLSDLLEGNYSSVLLK